MIIRGVNEKQVAQNITSDVEQSRINLDSNLVASTSLRGKNERYLTYGVSATEGFNLRVDVFIRVAHLVKLLPKAQNWTLVLPPWEHLDHWTSEMNQEGITWTQFYDFKSLKSYLPVLEMRDFLRNGQNKFDEVFVLQSDDRNILWNVETIDEAPCLIDQGYYRDVDGLYRGFLRCTDIYSEGYKCLSVHGTAHVLLRKLSNLTKAK
jgi:peptide-O-fucosyltransferase